MTVDYAKTWAGDIRRQVYQLIIIGASLVAIAGGYNYISLFKIDAVREASNNYHQLANNHYLRAAEGLRKIKIHIVGNINDDHGEEHTDAVSFFYVATERIDKGLMLEKNNGDPRFTAISETLAHRLNSLGTSYQSYENNVRGDQYLFDPVDGLLLTLEQIIRLHTVVRNDELQKLKELKNFHSTVFHLLIIVLSIIAAAVARQGFASIDGIIRKQIMAEEKIKHQAHYDNLTNLPNRILALDRLSQMMKEAQRCKNKVAVLFVDLDYFKKVNDMLGHVSGDKLLVEAAQRIKGSMRTGDTVGRLGGDEFIVLAGSISHTDEIMKVADKLISELGAAFEIDGKEFILTASIGISVYPDDGSENLELIRKADSAMYHSKEAGRNTYSYFTESMNSNIARQIALEEQIYGALDRGEFEVAYQQKVDLSSNRIIGAEALLRWNNEVLGAVRPDEFIPVAEQTGLIVPIGEFVLNEALAQTKRWREELLPEFRVAVNLSPRQFRDPNLINKISRSLLESGVPSKNLELEITEGLLMSEYIHIDQALTDLTNLGIFLAMDDFGTGYSSLSYLRDYPFDVIKIDRGFIQKIDHDSRSLELNHAAIAMAHALNIKVVAEGIETRSQFEVLQKLECDEGQGYYFGRPGSAQHMTELLQIQHQNTHSGAVVNIADRPGYSPNKQLSTQD